MRFLRASLLWIASASCLFFVACGGGGGGTTSSTSPVTGPITITTASILPGTISGKPYSTPLAVTNANGAVKWSINPISATALFPTGLSIDASTGIVSGTANFNGTGGFVATAVDAKGGIANKQFTVTASPQLTASISSNLTTTEFTVVNWAPLSAQGGVAPLTYSVTTGSLPPGMRLNPTTGALEGSATSAGTFNASVSVKDSYSPPEVVSANFTATVSPLPLFINGITGTIANLTVPFVGGVAAGGGSPPYQFSLESGSLPPGIVLLDPASGKLSGTPTQLGTYNYVIKVADAQSHVASFSGFIIVRTAKGRNDSPQTATIVAPTQAMFASISPYIDPPDKAPTPGDSDYYSITSLPGATVHLAVQAKQLSSSNPLDSVLEIVDANGARLSVCRDVSDTTGPFTSSCINDDTASSKDSAIDMLVPGTPGVPTTFYAHVLDWRGDARPDMRYTLVVTGVQPPFMIFTTSLAQAIRGMSYSASLQAGYGTGSYSWSILSGALPPGLQISSTTGLISGTPTSSGDYTFTLQVVDSATPPNTVTRQFTINVFDPPVITSPSTLPAACVNQPYNYTLQVSGGVPPITFGFGAPPALGIVLDSQTGVLHGTPTSTGTFSGIIFVYDASYAFPPVNVSLTVQNCP